MKNASCFIFRLPCTKNSTISKWKVVQTPTSSLDFPYTEQGSPHLHTEHHLNRLTHEYIKHDSHWLH